MINIITTSGIFQKYYVGAVCLFSCFSQVGKSSEQLKDWAMEDGQKKLNNNVHGSASNCYQLLIFTFKYVLLGCEILRSAFKSSQASLKVLKSKTEANITNTCYRKTWLCYIIKYFETISTVTICCNKPFLTRVGPLWQIMVPSIEC